MEIKLIEDKESGLEIQIRYPAMNVQVEQLIQKIKSIDIKIKGSVDKESILLDISNILYIECLERKTFIYTRDQVYRSNKRLHVLFEELTPFGFIQISKSCLLNMYELHSVRTIFNSRLEARLSNGEKIIISRRFIPALKLWLKEEAEDYDE